MKINRKTLVPLAMVLLIVAGISSTALVAFAQDTGTTQDSTVCGIADTDDVQNESENEDDGANETQCPEDSAEDAGSADCGVADTDDVQNESENEDDDANETQCPEDSVEDADSVQDPSYTGSIIVDDSVSYLSEEDEIVALAPLATITAEDAQTIVETDTGALVVKVELDNENGVLVYSVELEDGSDVKVDAGDGSILHTEAAGSDSSN